MHYSHYMNNKVLILFLIISKLSFSQEYDFGKNIDRIYIEEIKQFSNYFILNTEKSGKFNLTNISCEHFNDSNITLSSTEFKVSISTIKFNSINHIIHQNDSLQYLDKIDGKPFYNDYAVDTPKTEITKLKCWINNEQISIPLELYNDLYDPIMIYEKGCFVRAFSSPNLERHYVYVMGMNDGYEVTFIFDNGIFIDRLLIDNNH